MIQLYIYVYILYQILFHYRLLQDNEYSSLCYIVGPYYPRGLQDLSSLTRDQTGAPCSGSAEP